MSESIKPIILIGLMLVFYFSILRIWHSPGLYGTTRLIPYIVHFIGFLLSEKSVLRINTRLFSFKPEITFPYWAGTSKKTGRPDWIHTLYSRELLYTSCNKLISVAAAATIGAAAPNAGKHTQRLLTLTPLFIWLRSHLKYKCTSVPDLWMIEPGIG